MGHAEAHFLLACMYASGRGVVKDMSKVIHHYEEAAIGGHPRARCGLGYLEWTNGNAERAVKHYVIAATQGFDNSIKELMKVYRSGFVKKEVLAATLRAHKAAVDATKSPQREEAAADGDWEDWVRENCN